MRQKDNTETERQNRDRKTMRQKDKEEAERQCRDRKTMQRQKDID